MIQEVVGYKRGFILAFLLIFGISFALIPYLFASAIFPEYVQMLGQITIVALFFFWIGSLELGFPSIKTPIVVLNFDKFLFLVFCLFLLVVGTIIVTAPKIPLIESIKGSGADELSSYREEFLKARTGWSVSLGYAIGMINSYLLPYLIVLSFEHKKPYRFIIALIFVLYSISSLEKAYFLKIGIPLFFLYFFKSKNKLFFILTGASIFVLVFIVMFILSGMDGTATVRDEDFFSILYTPQGVVESFLWRSVAVPIMTALDGVRVFTTDFSGQFFMGQSSSLLAFLTGREQINFERALYQVQFGGTETGNANQCFIVEAYINFGFIGVILFSIFIGRIVSFIFNKREYALLSILPMIFFNLYNAGLIGIMLSNGLLFFVLFVRFFKFNFNSSPDSSLQI
jgi:oligosaccharide repeat unit polymerase